MARVTVIGAGAWGVALALTAARAGQTVTLWGRQPKKLALLSDLPWWSPALERTSHLEKALGEAENLIFALPAQTFRAFFEHTPPHVPLIIACKGIETESGLLLSEIVQSWRWKIPFGFLGGPHLASEVSQGLPTAGTLGISHFSHDEAWMYLLQHANFKLTLSSDLIGVQVAGALKNVFAIVAGLAMGAGWGENACAALLTQGLQEMHQLGEALGADKATFWTQAGIGDFMLTCLSPRSRNTRFGIRLAGGENPDPQAPLAEGFFTVRAVVKRAQKRGLSLPMIETLHSLLETPESISKLLPQLLEILT